MSANALSPRLWWLALLVPAVVYGQGDLATITGMVTDSSKAVIVGASVTVRNTATNVPHATTTNKDGYFTVIELPPGHYELSVSMQGFKAYHASNIVLETGQQLRSDIELELGSIAETIVVTAEAPPLNTENGAIKGAVIVQEEIQDVPLDGRNFYDIALLVPGVLPKAQGGTGSDTSVNGARGDNTNFYVDGLNDRNARDAGVQLSPNIDAIEEFKVETSGFSAQYGKMAGGILNMVLKSGTNHLHGSLFEYLRNDLFDARSFFDSGKSPLRRNQFGANIMGPIVLPKIYNGRNRTFFMLSFEAYRQTVGDTRLSNVPTLAERAGDFSNILGHSGRLIQIKDPLDGNKPFPGGIIPASRISPVALRVSKYYPAPNYTGVGLNYRASAITVNNWESILGKVDHRFSEKDSISVRYGYRWNPAIAPWAGTNLGGFGNVNHNNRSLGGITHVHLFSPTVINEFRAGVSRSVGNQAIDMSAGQPTAAQLGIAGSTTDPAVAGFPRVTVTNYAILGYANNQPLQFFVTDYQTGDVLTWTKGKHVLKFGADISIDTFNQPYYDNQRGSLTANGMWTGGGNAANGDAFADLMLGFLNNSGITRIPTRNYWRWRDYGAFVNDDFRVTSTLTLNLGLRYEIDGHPRDKYGRIMNFLPERNMIVIASDKTLPGLNQLLGQAGLTTRVGLARDYGLPDALVFTNYNNLAPRFGFAWRPGGARRMVLRGGYGWFYSGTVLNNIRVDLGTSFPFSTNLSFNRKTNDPNALTLADPWPASIATLAGTTTGHGFQANAPTAYAQNYNLTFERDLGRANVLEVAYLGSKGTHLGQRYNINQPYRSIASYMANGSSFPTPYPPWSTMYYYDFRSNSIYNAGQIMLRRRSAGGFFYRLAYTFSKAIDGASELNDSSAGGYAGAIDARNLSLERGRANFDRGHAFTAMFSYRLPVGRGKLLLRDSGKVLNGIFGGWQLSGTAAAYTGQPFTVQDSSINANIGQSDRPNRIATGANPPGTGRKGVDYRWYDVRAFVATVDCASRTDCSPDQYGFVPFAPGNSGRNILDGPGMFNINTTLMKDFRMGEQRRVQARWEVFNILNHPNFQLPNRNFNETSGGVISSVQSSGGPRIMQFALKYVF